MNNKRRYRELPDIELGPELDARVKVMTEAADRDLEAARVSFQWGPEQLATVKRAAQILGVAYPAYIKQVVFRQAVADIRDAKSVEASVDG